MAFSLYKFDEFKQVQILNESIVELIIIHTSFSFNSDGTFAVKKD